MTSFHCLVGLPFPWWQPTYPFWVMWSICSGNSVASPDVFTFLAITTMK